MLGKDLLGLYDTSAEDIVAILDTAVGMKKLLTQNLKKQSSAGVGAHRDHTLLRETARAPVVRSSSPPNTSALGR